MSAHLLRGKEVAEALLTELKTQIATLDFTPKLVFIRVGEDPASVSYVRGKNRSAQELGIEAVLHALPESTTQEELLTLVQELNADETVDGILVQLPLPEGLDAQGVLETIHPAKDVDGFHPMNVGKLWTGQDALVSCTPAGLIRMMDHFGLPLEGKHVVIVGRSSIVGKPAAALFLARNATVTLAHSRTKDLPAMTRQADVLVAAVGKRAFITPEMVKPGAVVLDVGITREDGKLHGDVHPTVAEVAAHLTPMPGGTGVMTVAMLMQNTLNAALWRRGRGPA